MQLLFLLPDLALQFFGNPFLSLPLSQKVILHIYFSIMSRFIFTPIGLEMALALQADQDELKDGPPQPALPRTFKMNHLLQQCNRFRIKTLKQNFAPTPRLS